MLKRDVVKFVQGLAQIKSSDVHRISNVEPDDGLVYGLPGPVSTE